MSEPQTIHHHSSPRVPLTETEQTYRAGVHRMWSGVAIILALTFCGTVIMDRWAPASPAQVAMQCVKRGDKIIATRLLVLCENAGVAALDEWSRPRRRVADAGGE